MATPEQESQMASELKSVLVELKDIDIPSLVRREELGTMSFEPGLPYFERSLRLYRELEKIDLSTVPYQTLSSTRDRAKELLATLNEVKTFSFTKFPNNAQSQHDSLINTIRDRYDTEFAQLTPTISYGIRRGTDFDRLEREAKTTLSAMATLLEDQRKAKDETAKQVHDTLEEVRKLAREAGVSQHADLFNEEAKEHATSASKWLTATICVAVGTTVVAGLLLTLSWLYTPNDITATKAVQIGIAKIAILSFLFSALLWVGRMYRSHRHNYVINRHRLNALRTFETFVRGTSDDATKNAVLIQATQCIFSPQATGYNSGESETNPATSILEIVRSSGKSES